MFRSLLIYFIVAITGSSLVPAQAAKVPTNLAWLFDLNEGSDTATIPQRSICETKECKLMAQAVKESMNDNVDPCDDFYEYACGNWGNNNPIPEGEKAWGLWYMVSKTIDDQIEGIIKSPAEPEDLLPVKLAKKWYKVCTDTDAMNERGLDQVISTLSRAGGWPLIMEPDEWDEDSHPWQKVDDYYTRLTARNTFHDLVAINYPEIGRFLLIDTPHFPPRTYRLIGKMPEDDGDESDENEEDNSEEEGSHQTEEEDDEEDEDVEEDIYKKLKKIRAVGQRRHRAPRKVAKPVHKNKVAKTRKIKRIKREVFRRSHARAEEEMERRKQKKQRRHNLHDQRKNINKKTKLKTTKNQHPVKVHSRSSRKNTNHIVQKEHERRFSHKSNNVGAHRRKNREDKLDEAAAAEEEGSGDVDDDTENGDDEDDGDDYDDDESDTEEDSEDDDDEDEGDDDEDDEDDEEVAERMRERYKEYIMAVAVALSEAREAEIPKEKLSKDIDDLIEFQIRLYQLGQGDYDYMNSTLSDFQDWYDDLKPETSKGKVRWTKKIERLFAEAGVDLEENVELLVLCQKYMRRLRVLLDETPSETIVNYVHWNFLSQTLVATTRDLRLRTLNWTSSETDSDKEIDEASERSRVCTNQMKMGDIIGYQYVQKHFSDDILQSAKDMIDDIEKEVEYQIKESDWLDEDTKDFILDKLVNMKKLIGYPDWYRNATIVKRRFRGLVVGPSYYENLLGFSRYEKWQDLRDFMAEEPEEDWMVDPTILNAFFIPTINSITITAADFQHPLFAYRRPQLINFGIIGFVMAHEVNHGFDDQGHFYNKNGNVMEWLSAMAEAYNRRAECFVDQFNAYSVVRGENITIEDYGNQTSGENIADTMGLQAVYRAYKRRERECGAPEAALPGLENLTNDQLFFLSFAHLWCEVVDPELEKSMATMDEHSTGRLRVIGSVSNSMDFAKAYDCPAGSPMNPEKKCNIWK